MPLREPRDVWIPNAHWFPDNLVFDPDAVERIYRKARAAEYGLTYDVFVQRIRANDPTGFDLREYVGTWLDYRNSDLHTISQDRIQQRALGRLFTLKDLIKLFPPSTWQRLVPHNLVWTHTFGTINVFFWDLYPTTDLDGNEVLRPLEQPQVLPILSSLLSADDEEIRCRARAILNSRAADDLMESTAGVNSESTICELVRPEYHPLISHSTSREKLAHFCHKHPFYLQLDIPFNHSTKELEYYLDDVARFALRSRLGLPKDAATEAFKEYTSIKRWTESCQARGLFIQAPPQPPLQNSSFTPNRIEYPRTSPGLRRKRTLDDSNSGAQDGNTSPPTKRLKTTSLLLQPLAHEENAEGVAGPSNPSRTTERRLVQRPESMDLEEVTRRAEALNPTRSRTHLSSLPPLNGHIVTRPTPQHSPEVDGNERISSLDEAAQSHESGTWPNQESLRGSISRHGTPSIPHRERAQVPTNNNPEIPESLVNEASDSEDEEGSTDEEEDDENESEEDKGETDDNEDEDEDLSEEDDEDEEDEVEQEEESVPKEAISDTIRPQVPEESAKVKPQENPPTKQYVGDENESVESASEEEDEDNEEGNEEEEGSEYEEDGSEDGEPATKLKEEVMTETAPASVLAQKALEVVEADGQESSASQPEADAVESPSEESASEEDLESEASATDSEAETEIRSQPASMKPTIPEVQSQEDAQQNPAEKVNETPVPVQAVSSSNGISKPEESSESDDGGSDSESSDESEIEVEPTKAEVDNVSQTLRLLAASRAVKRAKSMVQDSPAPEPVKTEPATQMKKEHESGSDTDSEDASGDSGSDSENDDESEASSPVSAVSYNWSQSRAATTEPTAKNDLASLPENARSVSVVAQPIATQPIVTQSTATQSNATQPVASQSIVIPPIATKPIPTPLVTAPPAAVTPVLAPSIMAPAITASAANTAAEEPNTQVGTQPISGQSSQQPSKQAPPKTTARRGAKTAAAGAPKKIVRKGAAKPPTNPPPKRGGGQGSGRPRGRPPRASQGGATRK